MNQLFFFCCDFKECKKTHTFHNSQRIFNQINHTHSVRFSWKKQYVENYHARKKVQNLEEKSERKRVQRNNSIAIAKQYVESIENIVYYCSQFRSIYCNVTYVCKRESAAHIQIVRLPYGETLQTLMLLNGWCLLFVSIYLRKKVLQNVMIMILYLSRCVFN